MEEKSIAHGVPWTFVTFGAAKVITLVTTVVLARLLTPADFGLMALAMLAFGALGLFQDLGLGATLILRQDFEERALGTILTLLILTSFVVAAIVIALAPLAATLLHEPRLTSLLPVLSTTSMFSSLAWFYESLLQREMEFKRRFVGQMAQSLGFAVVAISLALAGAGVWSLVLGQVASMVIYSATYLIIAPHRVRPRLDWTVTKEAFVSGRGFLAQGWLAWISENVDYLLVGRLLGSAQLGFYSMAYRLSELTHLGIADPVAKVTFPAFARMRRSGESVTATYLSILRLVALVTAVIGAVLSGAAAPFTAAIFGSNWLPMIGPLGVLGVWAAVVPIQATMGWLLNSTGHAGALGSLTAVVLVFEIPLLIVAAHSSTTAVSFVILGQAIVTLPLLARLAQRKLELHAVGHMRVLLPIVVAAAIGWIATRAAANATDGFAPIASLIVSGLLGVAAYSAAVAILDRDSLRLALSTARRLLGRDAVLPTA